MKMIDNWRNKKLKCHVCGKYENAKYYYEGKIYCSLCMADKTIKEKSLK